MPSKTNGRSSSSSSPTRTPTGAGSQPGVEIRLRRIERAFAALEWADRRTLQQARKRARGRAHDVLELAADEGSEAETAALLVAAAELLSALKVELAGRPKDAIRLANELERAAGVSRLALAREVLRGPELLTLAPNVAVEVQLVMLSAFAQLRAASLWVLDSAERVTCVLYVGERGPSRRARQLAQRLLAGGSADEGPRRVLIGLPVGHLPRPTAALVASAAPGLSERSRPFLAEAAPMLAAVVERDALRTGNAAAERALVESSERKLTRLGFDLHDGPIQDVAVLAQDLRVFAGQLEGALGEDAQDARGQLVRGRIEDLEAQLEALDSSLRRLSSAVRGPALLNRPFPKAVAEVVQAFSSRTGIEPDLSIEGELEVLSASQQMALLNIVHEALSNIREHSGASKVEVELQADANGIRAQIVDNGRGFDVESTLLRAARAGRVGLVGMHERVRLLGGQCRIESRPGGPTSVSVALERWEPLAVDAKQRGTSA
jgi:signal transduction histidine kinase